MAAGRDRGEYACLVAVGGLDHAAGEVAKEAYTIVGWGWTLEDP